MKKYKFGNQFKTVKPLRKRHVKLSFLVKKKKIKHRNKHWGKVFSNDVIEKQLRGENVSGL